MKSALDILASAIHDAKNQLFFAETKAAEIAAREGVDLGMVRTAIEQASNRLIRALTFYSVVDSGASIAISVVPVSELVEDGLASCGAQLDELGIAVEQDCASDALWPLDRDLVIDMLNNAAQNAGRHAKGRVRISTREDDGWLVLSVEDDGPGLPPGEERRQREGIGLFVAERIAMLHQRHGRTGQVKLYNGGRLGGAVFELWLP